MGCFFIRGSSIAVNKVKEERQTKVTETVETFMAWKKNIQCIATIAPVKKNCRNCFLEMDIFFLVIKNHAKSVEVAINTLYQTKGTASIEITFPRMPVKPQTSTVKCNIRRFFFVASIVILALFLAGRSLIIQKI